MEQINASGRLITLIHLVTQNNGSYRVACMPSLTEFHQTTQHDVIQRTDDIRAVTCNACKKVAGVTSGR